MLTAVRQICTDQVLVTRTISVPDAVMGTLKTLLKTTPDVVRRHVEYTVVKKSEEYEERWYPASTWVCTTVSSVYQDTAKIEGFRHLLAYAHGQNDAAAQLSVQPPILTRISSETGDGFERKFVVCTYLSGADGQGLPEPTNSNVFLEYLPEMTVFVRRFQGIACEERWTYETKHLAEIVRHKEDIRTDFYMTATYESPFQLVSGRNEIWFVKFDRKQNIAETKLKDNCVLKYGNQSVEIPSVFSWLLYFVLAYISFLLSFMKTSLTVSVLVKDNWEIVRERLRVLAFNLWTTVPFRTILNAGLSVMLTLWTLTVAIVTGYVDERGASNRKRKKNIR